MPSKTKTQIRKAKRIAAHGENDLAVGKLTARAVRCGILKGSFCMSKKAPPPPPPEWQPWKRDRFSLSIQAAHLFLRGKELDDIGGLVGKDTTKQRISQMVNQGVQFLLDRRYVEAVK